MNEKQLLNLAQEAREKSYSPYSGYAVGAALLTKDGKVYQGANIESASYSPTVCAERVAFFTAVMNGERDFEAIAIVGAKHGERGGYAAPCGVCRQVMTEFCEQDFKIILQAEGDIEVCTLGEIMPKSFTKDNLK